MDEVYMPPKPESPFTSPGVDCPAPGGHPPGWTYPPAEHPHHHPGPDVPDHMMPHPFPGLHDIPPIPSVQEGQSLYEAMNLQIQRTNACIEQWNEISKNCFAAMNACVEAARSNDVYYDNHEVRYQTGFDENEGCAYSIIEKKAVDRRGKPIFVKLVPAFKNTTNSGVTQDIFDVSFIESANVIITAVPTNQDRWVGPAMYKGAPIPGGEGVEGNYVYGFNRHGWLRVFPADTIDETGLYQNGMVNVIGSCWPILIDGKLTDTAQTLTTKASITAIGFNKGTGSVFFFSCSAQDQPGMTGVSVAKLLQGFGCTTAVITAMIDGANKNERCGMMYMGQMATVPQGGGTPENLAYWVITKREEHGPGFKNRFQKEIADLVQITGQNAWKNYLLGVQIQDFDERIIQNAKDIAAEVERAKSEEARIEKKLDDEIERAQDAEETLDEKIEAETQRATNAEADLHQEIVDETNRAKQRENELDAAIQAEKLRAQKRENEIQDALDKEIRERIAADNDIINALEQEVLARRAADTALENKIDATKNELLITINNIKNQLDGLTSGQTELPYLKLTGGTLTGSVNFTENNTLTLGRGPTEDMEAATKKYVDEAVAAGGGGGGGGGDVSKEYVDQQVSNLQGQLDGKVNKAGDTMTGTLNMNQNKITAPVLEDANGVRVENGAGQPGTITNLADPVNDSDAVPKSYLDRQIEEAKETLKEDFLPTAGGEMTGDINMTGDSVVKFYDPVQVGADLAKAAVTKTSTAVNIRPSAAAKRLGITSELIADAYAKGLSVTADTTNADIITATGVVPYALEGQDLKGSVYNDNADMVVKSETGSVRLIGENVKVSSPTGDHISLQGVDGIGPDSTPAIDMSGARMDIVGPLDVSTVPKDANGEIKAGTVRTAVIGAQKDSSNLTVKGSNLMSEAFIVGNSGASLGSLYLQNTQNKSNQTTISIDSATNALQIMTGSDDSKARPVIFSNPNGSKAQLKGVADGTDDDDVATVGQVNSGNMKQLITTGLNADLKKVTIGLFIRTDRERPFNKSITLPAKTGETITDIFIKFSGYANTIGTTAFDYTSIPSMYHLTNTKSVTVYNLNYDKNIKTEAVQASLNNNVLSLYTNTSSYSVIGIVEVFWRGDV